MPKRLGQTDTQEGFKDLYGQESLDLTPEGYMERIRKLRRKDPAKARRIERALDATLTERVFSRRQVKWHMTSQGTRARVELMPRNPYLGQDVRTIRHVLGIPVAHVKATPGDRLWNDLVAHRVKPRSVKRVAEGNLAGSWYHLHSQSALGNRTTRGEVTLLAEKFRRSAVASARVDLSADSSPAWLRSPPHGPPPYDTPTVPLDWAVGRLVERHRLPWNAASPLRFYVLTLDSSWIRHVEPFDVGIVQQSASLADPGSFTISVGWIDEFVTHEDWDHIWKKYVRPRQDNLWRERAMKPQGQRSVDISRLKRFIPVYRQIAGGQASSADRAAKPLPSALEDFDDATVRHAMEDLMQLLAPSA